MTKKRVLIVSLVVSLATLAAIFVVNLSLDTMFGLGAGSIWFALWAGIAFYGVLIGLIWWAYPRSRSRVEHRTRFLCSPALARRVRSWHQLVGQRRPGGGYSRRWLGQP